uniref:Reverse transcriptase domain-containing protein n=1 Tax=Anolis carolinensis TaxID=28377 RepID=A0A803TYM6_ANOCA
MGESEEELRRLITKVKEESAKAGLQLNVKKTKSMPTTPIDNWQIEGENVEAVTDFIFLGMKITADVDRSQEIRRRLLLGRRAMANLDKIVKSRDITLATKVRIVKAMVLPIVTYGCESWTIRKAERRKIDAFELWCWRKILRVPWTARRTNQSILQEIMPGCSLEGRILEAKLKYFGHIMRRQESLEKITMLGKMEGKRKRGQASHFKDTIHPSCPWLAPLPFPFHFPQHHFSKLFCLLIMWPKYFIFASNILPASEQPVIISWRMDWLDLLAVQGTLRIFLQHHSSKASIFLLSALLMVQLSHP